jgi:Putative RNA methylase family UPF0020
VTLTIRPPAWALQDFERDLALREVVSLTGKAAHWQDGLITVDGSRQANDARRLAHRLALAGEIETSTGLRLSTVQQRLEQADGARGRKTTSHALHGLHPYKGKFYPQLARALLNVCGVREHAKVLDPFAGCGTTALEATLLGMKGVGVDSNPLAVLVAQTKLAVLAREPDELRRALAPLAKLPPREQPLADLDYLRRWLPKANLKHLRRLLAGISALDDADARRLALVCLSSVLREASYQDPAQLRILRRRPDAEIAPLLGMFRAALADALSDVEAVREVQEVNWSSFSRAAHRVIHGDSRKLLASLRRHGKGSFDAVITSPPYTNALPYIDTDRLSLRAFDMLDDEGQRGAERRQIGNREVPDREIRHINADVEREIKDPRLSHDLRDVLVKARRVAREPSAGFRKQRTPALLFTYFTDMRTVLQQVATLLKPGAPAVFVVGDSTISAPDNGTLRVPTGSIIEELATGAKLTLTSTLDKRLTSYGASSTVHQRNAMARERVLIFRRTED